VEYKKGVPSISDLPSIPSYFPFFMKDTVISTKKNLLTFIILKELAKFSEEYEIDPIKDLRPVCPNCHAMLHRRTPAYTIEELK
jgi:hypothetical protein